MFTTRPELRGSFGMVASTHWLASGAGMSVLERGGNAVDAAVAAAFVLQVVEPHLNGPGGDVPVLVAAPGGDVQVYCGQGPTPAAATLEAFAALGPRPRARARACWPPSSRARSARGRCCSSSGAPGGCATSSSRRSRTPSDGYPLLPGAVATIAARRGAVPRRVADLGCDLADGGRAAGGGRPLAQRGARRRPGRRVVAEAEAAEQDPRGAARAARDAFYRGWVAEASPTGARRRRSWTPPGSATRGLLTDDDLARWQPTVEPSVSVEHAGLTVHKTGPWGQGMVLLQQLQLLDGVDLAGMGHLSAEAVHTVIECAKLAFADREAWYGDPAPSTCPSRPCSRRSTPRSGARSSATTASYELRPGSPDGRTPQLPDGVLGPGERPAVTSDGAGEPTVLGDGSTRGDTCHVDVVDRDG